MAKKEIIKGTNITDRLVLDQTDENFNVYPNIDAKYGPFSSKEEALRILDKRVRAKGLTIGIIQADNTINEYWFKAGIEDSNLVEKLAGADYGNAIEELENQVFPLTFESFNPGVTVFEKGATMIPAINWRVIRKEEQVTLDTASVIENGQAVGKVSADKNSWSREKSVTSDVDYVVNLSRGSQKLSKTVSYSFRLKKYYGVSSKKELTNDDILNMMSEFAYNATLKPTMFDCSGGKYPFYVIPTSMYGENVEFWIGGFRNSDIVVTPIDVTNPFNVTENYTVMRLGGIQTGTLRIEVKINNV